jgi:hypothetical protein
MAKARRSAHRSSKGTKLYAVALKRFSLIGLAAVLSLVTTAATAAPIIFFGEDPGLGDGTVLASTPNADAAHASFLTGLIHPGVETFESIAASPEGPYALNFANGITANLSLGTVEVLPDGTANLIGAYGITGDPDRDEHHVETAGGPFMVLTFSQPVSAFGFFGIDIGDDGGQLSVTTGGGLNQLFNVGHTVGGTGGGVFFWGIIDPLQTFTSIEFGNTDLLEIYAFDDFTVEALVQVLEPATLGLFGVGLAVAVGRRSFRKR